MDFFNLLKKHIPRWVILLIDLFVILSSIFIAYFIRFNFSIPVEYSNTFLYVIPIVLLVRLSAFLISRTYAGIVRYTSIKDAIRFFLTIGIGSLMFVIMNFISYFKTGLNFMPTSIILIDFLLSLFLLVASRLLIKTLYFENTNKQDPNKNVIIYGAGELGFITKNTLNQDETTNYNVVAFIDNKINGKKIDGVNIYKSENLIKVIDKYAVSHLLLAHKSNNKKEKQRIINICIEKNVKILTVPQVKDWIDGRLSFKQIKKLNINDLLERATIELDKKKIEKTIFEKTVLVTGAAGSIGSEIVRQLLKFNPKKIIVFDQAESPLYEIELELTEKYNFSRFEIVIGDVRNKTRVEKVFQTYKPSIVYHAAAYKHVPMMENNPSEAVSTNVNGTKIIADTSVEFGVEKFVMISTDKAVKPTNVMGASKRIAEIYTQSLNQVCDTKFITTRFGNVLGSNGSVIPRFKKQIENGTSVTVTHPDITRYFMTIPEACQLVLEASAFGKGGEIFIFDMGESVKIADLAKKMIKLYDLELGKDIEINYTGLRPGEKLYEELLNDTENTIATHHSKIMIAKVRKYDYNKIATKIDNMIKILSRNDNFEIVTLMKDIVPEFVSQNSEYSKLDTNNSQETNNSKTFINLNEIEHIKINNSLIKN